MDPACRACLDLTPPPTHSFTAGSTPRWTRRQYLALLHLYVFEALLRELREPAGALFHTYPAEEAMVPLC